MGAKLDYARGRWIALLVLVWLLVPTHVFAGTTGNLTGFITNQDGDPIGNARITLTSPALQGAQTTASNEQGFFRVFALPPGNYTAEVEGPGYVRTKRENIVILVDQTIRADLKLTKIGADTTEDDVIIITERAPVVEQGSTTIGANLSGDFLNQVPTGRRMNTVLALTPGANTDQLGTSFMGSSSPENAIVIDGVNTTGVDYGLVSTNLPIEFIDQIEVKTAGYGAEFGRSTGAFVNTILKQGGNEFHGDVFAYITPIQGQPEPSVYASAGGDPITRTDTIKYSLDVGFDVGGYIVKDKLWFFAGFVPSITNVTTTRTLGEGENAERVYDSLTRRGYFVGKLTYRLNEDHSMILSVIGDPYSFTGPRGTTAVSLAGTESTYMYKSLIDSQFDGSLRWNSKLADDTINIEFLAGYHTEIYDQNPYGTEGDTRFAGDVGYAPRNIYMATIAVPGETGVDGTDLAAPTCSGGDCYAYQFSTGGFDHMEEARRSRITGTLKTTHYLNDLMGNHKFLWGGDFELVTFNNTRAYSGGHRNRFFPTSDGGLVRREHYYAQHMSSVQECEDRWGTTADGVLQEALVVGTDENGAPNDVACLLNYFPAITNNVNVSAFAQESWSILDNLTLNLGVRWEMQQLRGIAGQDGGLGPVNIGIYNNWAPRLGFIFDPTNKGKSKVFGSYGRYFENIPMDINDRVFSNEGFARVYHDVSDSANPITDQGYYRTAFLGGYLTPIQNDLKSQYLDEFLLGVEYEVADNLAIGAKYVDRRMGSIVEDISPDDGNNYMVSNPGPPNEGGTYFYDPNTGLDYAVYDVDPNHAGQCQVEFLDDQGNVSGGQYDLPCFPEASRTYQGVELTARKGFSDNWTMLASYVLSWTYGNYPGLFTPENGQLDPNITSQFDLPSLLTNRQGFLPQDTRHVFKLHGSYSFDWGLLAGIGMNVAGGTPYSNLAAHEYYGTGEAFLSPRGDGGRTPSRSTIDGNLEYYIPVGEGKNVSLQLEAFNIFNFQNLIRVDQDYTLAYAYSPQDGQSIDQALCQYDSSLDTDGVVTRDEGAIAYCSEMANPSFGTGSAFQTPRSVRFGLKFSF